MTIPYQINDGGIVALLPDGRVEFLHPAIQPLLDDVRAGRIASTEIDFDDYVMQSPLVRLDQFHLAAPAIAFIETTNLCNLRCKHCYAWSGRKRPSEMSTATILRLIDEFSDMGVLQVFLSGGELFAHKDAVEIITHARTKPFSTQIFTNGLLITENKLAQIPTGTSFFISFDTADPDRTIRGRMDFPRLRRVFDSMLEYGHIFRTAISVHRSNIHDALEIFEWCAEHGYPRPQWLETHPIGRALLHPEMLLQPEHIDEVFKIYRQCMEHYSEDPAGQEEIASRDNAAATVRSIDTIKFCQRLERATNQEKCGRSIVYVDSSGEVFPCSNCMSNRIYRAGNLANASFHDIWASGFDAFRRITFSEHEVCNNCAVHQAGVWCQFRCPPLAQNVSSDERGCGATEYLRHFMLLTNNYWEERRRAGIKLTMAPASTSTRQSHSRS